MALNATIYKYTIAISDLNRHYYDNVQLTVAKHPSETNERMVARVLAYCMNAQPSLQFTKGLSTPDTPDLWMRDLTDNVELWIEVGEPSTDKLKKATRMAQQVLVYAFNSKSNIWWEQSKKKISILPLTVIRLPWDAIMTVSAFVQRTTAMSVTITGESAFIAADNGECDMSWSVLHSPQK